MMQDPNVNKEGEDLLSSHNVIDSIDISSLEESQSYYVPIYSDIYFDVANQSVLLSATLSIRNMNFKDTLFVSDIEYYDTEGELVRSYLEGMIAIKPMATINYVIEREDAAGGPGANFIINTSSRSSYTKPLIQAVMIGDHSNKGFAFSTDAYEIKR